MAVRSVDHAHAAGSRHRIARLRRDSLLPNIRFEKIEKSFGNVLWYEPAHVDWGVIMATGMLLAVPPIIFTFMASRQIITGMTAGAVKG